MNRKNIFFFLLLCSFFSEAQPMISEDSQERELKIETLEEEKKKENSVPLESEYGQLIDETRNEPTTSAIPREQRDELITRLVDIFYHSDWVVTKNADRESCGVRRNSNDIDNLRSWLELCTVEQLARIAYKVQEKIGKDISSIYKDYIHFNNLEAAKAVLYHIFNPKQFNVDPFIEAIDEKNKSPYSVIDETGVLLKVFRENQVLENLAQEDTCMVFEQGNSSAADFLRLLNKIEEQYGESGDKLTIKEYFQEEPCLLKATAYTALTMLGAKEILSAVTAKVPAIERAIESKAKIVLLSSCFAGGTALWYRSLMKTNTAELKRELERVEKIHATLLIKKLSPECKPSNRIKQEYKEKIFRQLKGMMSEREYFMSAYRANSSLLDERS